MKMVLGHYDNGEFGLQKEEILSMKIIFITGLIWLILGLIGFVIIISDDSRITPSLLGIGFGFTLIILNEALKKE